MTQRRDESPPRGVRLGFRHADAGIGDETAQSGLHCVGYSQERQAARDVVEGRDSALAMPNLKAAMTAAWGWERFGNTLLIWLVQWRNGSVGSRARFSLRLWFHHKDGSAFARESTFSYATSEKRKAVSIEEEGDPPAAIHTCDWVACDCAAACAYKEYRRSEPLRLRGKSVIQ